MSPKDLQNLEEYTKAVLRLPKMNFLTAAQNFFLGENGKHPDMKSVINEMHEMQALAELAYKASKPGSELYLRAEKILGHKNDAR